MSSNVGDSPVVRMIVVGVDPMGNEGGALRWVQPLAKAVGARVILVSAAGPLQAGLSAPAYRSKLGKHEARLQRSADELIADGIECDFIVVDDDPRRTLIETSKRVGADLVVIGFSELSPGPGFFHLGSVGEYLAHHIDRPLVIVHNDDPVVRHRVVLGVDGSVASRAAARFCAAYAAAVGADVRAVAVEEPLMRSGVDVDEPEWFRAMEAVVEQVWAAPAAAVATNFVADIRRDPHPADVIVRVADEWPAGLIVVGARGLGGFLGLRAGGVAMKVLHRAHRTVMLVPDTV